MVFGARSGVRERKERVNAPNGRRKAVNCSERVGIFDQKLKVGMEKSRKRGKQDRRITERRFRFEEESKPVPFENQTPKGAAPALDIGVRCLHPPSVSGGSCGLG